MDFTWTGFGNLNTLNKVRLWRASWLFTTHTRGVLEKWLSGRAFPHSCMDKVAGQLNSVLVPESLPSISPPSLKDSNCLGRNLWHSCKPIRCFSSREMSGSMVRFFVVEQFFSAHVKITWHSIAEFWSTIKVRRVLGLADVGVFNSFTQSQRIANAGG